MKSFTRYLVIGFAMFISIPAMATKPMPDRGLEILPEETEASYRLENMRISAETGIPLALYRVNYAVQPGTPLQMAQQYLRENAVLLGLPKDLEGVVHRVTTETPGGYHVRFIQKKNGYPVYNSEIVVNIDRRYTVTFVMNGYKPRAKLTARSAAVSTGAALQIAKNYLDVRGKINFEKSETIVYYNKGKTRLVQRVTLVPAEDKFGDWEILVDAHTGEIIRVQDKSLYGGGHSRATASGWVFDPDPLTRARALYQAGGQFGDNNDNDTDSLVAQIVEVPLLDVTFSGGLYQLDGTYANIEDFEAPFKGQFSQPDSNFHFTRNPDAFEAVTVYYHIDKSMRYINETLGISLMPYQYSGGVRVDPHGLNGSDNSHYISSTGQIAWGEGGVDDSEDEDVILHELGHGLHDWLTVGGISQVDGLSEGCGDYWAASYNRSTGFWTPSDPQYYWVFQWDGHNEFWPGRVTNYSAHYPEGLTGQIHTDGQMWASTLMQIWDDIGREATDSDFLEGLAMTGGSTNQEDAAQAFIQADINRYNGIHLTQIEFWFQQRGYNVTIPAPSIVHDPLPDIEDVIGPYLVTAEITAGIPLAVANLIYGTNGMFTDTVAMSAAGNQYTAAIPGTGVPTSYNYYIFAADSNGLASTSPPGAPANYHAFYAGPDTIAPVITHTPLRNQPLVRWPAVVQAQIEDNLGIASAMVEYQVNNGAITGSFPLTNSSGNLYQGIFDIDTSQVGLGDSIEYRIIAVDASNQSNQTIDPPAGFHSFKIIDVLGVVLVIDDDPTTPKVHISEKGRSVRDVTANPFGRSSEVMTQYLNDLGYLATEEEANQTDPATWGNYDLIISSSGISETTLANNNYRNALIAYSQNGGKFIIEGGEVGWEWRNDNNVMTYLLHSDDWNADDAGPLNLISAHTNHPMVNIPNVLPSQIGIIYTAYGSEDAMSATDSYVLYATTDYPTYAGISIYDDNADPTSTQSVYYAFNFAQVTDTTVAKHLLENTMNYLLTPEGTNQAPQVVNPMSDIIMDEDHPQFTVADLDTVFDDPDGDVLTYTTASSDPGVVPAIDGDNVLMLSLEPNYFGSAMVVVTGSDNQASVSDTIQVTVNPVNDAPSVFSLLLPADGDSVNGIQHPVTFVWQASQDVENDPLTYSLNVYNGGLDTTITDIQDTTYTLDGTTFFQNNTTYNWTVSVSDGDLTTASADTFSFVVSDQVVGIAYGSQSLPQEFELSQNYPNPFNPTTMIKYALPVSGRVQIVVYNTLGQVVRTLVAAHREAGFHQVVWDGTNENGQRVGSGIYLYTVRAGDFSAVKKMILLK